MHKEEAFVEYSSINIIRKNVGKAPAIGIDLGTTFSCVGVFRNNKLEIIPNDHGNRFTPSWVAFTDTGRLLVGDAAKSQASMNPTSTVYNIKRLIGRKVDDPKVKSDIEHWPFAVLDQGGKPVVQVEFKGTKKTLYPEQISAIILSEMKRIAEAYFGGLEVTDAIITVPAHFTESQRQATIDAGIIAGLNVLRIINESTAAAIAYSFENKSEKSEEKNVLIFDVGGGTSNVTIVNVESGVLEIKSTAGNMHLGGEDFDMRMVDYFVEEFKSKHKKDISSNKRALQRLKTVCERAKRKLSMLHTANIEIDALHEGIDFYTNITRDKFEELSLDLFKVMMEPIERALSDAKLDKSQIDDIVLVGGSTRIPKVQKLLQEFFNGKELNRSINPEEAVAHGAAVQAAILTGDMSEAVKDLVLIDVTPISLGIETANGTMATVIKRNTIIPTNRTRFFTTNTSGKPKDANSDEDTQLDVIAMQGTSCTLNVYEGEQEMAKENNLLGTLKLHNITPASSGGSEIEVAFDIDANGILNVSAVDLSTEKEKKITISKHVFSPKELERMIIEALEYNKADQSERDRLEAKNSFESYCFSKKDLIEDALKWLESNPNVKKDEIETKLKELQKAVRS